MRDFLFSRTGLVLLGFLAVAGYFLWAEHEAHIVGVLPWLLLGGCLMLYLFLHRGHGGDHDSHHRRPGGGGEER